MGRKVKVTLEMEFSDLPEDAQDEIEAMYEGDEVENPPKASDYTVEEIAVEARSFFDTLDDYEMQRELWAGSSVYAMFTPIKVLTVEVVEEQGESNGK